MPAKYSIRRSMSEVFHRRTVFITQEFNGLLELHKNDVLPSEWEGSERCRCSAGKDDPCPRGDLRLLSKAAIRNLKHRFLLRQRLHQAITEGRALKARTLAVMLANCYHELGLTTEGSN